jgi:hypothetical protein
LTAGAVGRAAASVRGWQVWTLPRSARAYVIAVVALDWAVTLAALVITADRVSLAHFGLYLGLLGCGAALVERRSRKRGPTAATR